MNILTADHLRQARVRTLQRTALMALLCIAATGKGNAEEVSHTRDSELATLTSKISGTTLRIAEPLTLELTVTAPAGSTVDFPSIGKSLGNFDVIDQTDRVDVPSANDVNQRTWTRRLTLESIVTGDLEIPALEILVRNGANAQTLTAAAIPVRIISILEDRADPTQFRDIQSVVDVAVPQPVSHAWLWWTLGGFAGTATAALMFVAVAKRRTWMTPEIWAIRELDHLRGSESMKVSDSEMVTDRLTTILRDYLELQFDIATPVRTTAELLQLIENGHYMNAATITEYAGLFENSDLARFAGLQLTHAQLTSAIDNAQRLIEQTSNALKNEVR